MRYLATWVGLIFLAQSTWGQSFIIPKKTSGKSKDKTVYVATDGSGHYRSIQQAINDADFNTVIRVREGVYKENLQLKSFITMEGAGIGKTVVISETALPVVEAYNMGAGKVSRISFEYYPAQPAPVAVTKFSTFMFEECSFKNGSDGLDISSGSYITLQKCIVTGNRHRGIYIHDQSFGKVSECIVARNGSDGILVAEYSSPLLEQNTIRFNGKNGIAISTGSLCKIQGNYILKNGGHGIQVKHYAEPMIRNNTIVQNGDSLLTAATERSGFGIYLDSPGLITIINTIIANHQVGIGAVNATRTVRAYNNFWNNAIPYYNLNPSETDRRLDPKFRNPAEMDYRLDTTSALIRAGENGLSIGADYDFRASNTRRRIEYLKSLITQELAKENWYSAYQSALEIASLDKNDKEGKSLLEKTSQLLSKAYTEKAAQDFRSDNIRSATHYVENAIAIDPQNREAIELRETISYESTMSQVRFAAIFGGILLLLFGGGFIMRRRIQVSENRRQAKWWLDDAEEHVILARRGDGDRHAPEDMRMASEKVREARTAYDNKRYDLCETLSNEAVRFANRARDAADQYRKIQKEALFEVTAAEDLIRAQRDLKMDAYFPDAFREFAMVLQRAQDALINKQFHAAKEMSEYLQTALRKLRDQRLEETRKEVNDMIAETESMIIAALAGNSSADIVVAVIDFKSELETLKNGFINGQLSPEEVIGQVREIKEFITEVLRISGQEEPAAARGPKSPYEILGIKEDATLEQIKSVYHKLSMIYHPDVSQGQDLGIAGDARFKEIKQAYEFLVSERSKPKN